MNRGVKRLLALVAFSICCGFKQTEAKTVVQSQNYYIEKPFYGISKQMVPWLKCNLNEKDDSSFFGGLNAEFVYNRNFNTDSDTGLGALWGNSGSNVLTVGEGNSGYNLAAYNFGLGVVTGSETLTTSPLVQRIGGGFTFYLGTEFGIWFKAAAPLGVMKVNPQLTESGGLTAGAYQPGTLMVSSSAASTMPAIYQNMTQAMAASNANITSGTWYTPMQYGLINGEQSSSAKFGDVYLSFGYNFLQEEDKVLGLGVYATIPTGDAYNGKYIYGSPSFTNGKYFGLGGELVGSLQLWSSDKDEQSLDLNIDATGQYLFKNTQKRSFDLLNNGACSKYLLVGQFNGTADISTSGSATSLALSTFQNVIQNLINVSTLNCKSNFNFQGNLALALNYTKDKFNFELGSEFFYRMKENLSITDTLSNQYAVMGRMPIAPWNTNNNSSTPQALYIGLVDPNATINTNLSVVTNSSAGTYAFASSGANASTYAKVVTDYSGQVTGSTTWTPAFGANPANRIAGNAALDEEGAKLAAAASAKVYGKASYCFCDTEFKPELSVRVGADFSLINNTLTNMIDVGASVGFCF